MNTIKFNSLASKMLCIPQVTALDSAYEKAQAKQFRKSIEKAMLLLEGNKWLKDAEGKQYLKDIGSPLQEDVVKQAYGLNKAQYSLYIRVAKATERIPNLIENFLAKCEAKLGAASYGLQAFDDYIKALDKAVANPLPITEGNEGDEGGEGNIEDVMDKVEVSTKPIITLAFNGEAVGKKNVALKVTDKGELKTTSSVEDIEAVIAYLKNAVKKMKSSTTPKVEEKPKVSDKPKATAKPKVSTTPKVEEKPKVSKFKIALTPEQIKAKALADFEASLEPVESLDSEFDMDAPF